MLLASTAEHVNVDANDIDVIDPLLTKINKGWNIIFFIYLSMRFLYMLYSSLMLLNPVHFISAFGDVPGAE